MFIHFCHSEVRIPDLTFLRTCISLAEISFFSFSFCFSRRGPKGKEEKIKKQDQKQTLAREKKKKYRAEASTAAYTKQNGPQLCTKCCRRYARSRFWFCFLFVCCCWSFSSRPGLVSVCSVAVVNRHGLKYRHRHRHLPYTYTTEEAIGRLSAHARLKRRFLALGSIPSVSPTRKACPSAWPGAHATVGRSPPAGAWLCSAFRCHRCPLDAARGVVWSAASASPQAAPAPRILGFRTCSERPPRAPTRAACRASC